MGGSPSKSGGAVHGARVGGQADAIDGAFDLIGDLIHPNCARQYRESYWKEPPEAKFFFNDWEARDRSAREAGKFDERFSFPTYPHGRCYAHKK